MSVASLLAPFPSLSSLFSFASSSPRPATPLPIPQPTNQVPPRQRILHVAPDEILLSTPNPSTSYYYSIPQQRRLQEDNIADRPATPTPIQRLEMPPPLPILPEFCLYCVPLRTGIQIITSFDLVTSVYVVGVEAQTLQQYDAPLDVFPYSIKDADAPDFGELILKKEQMYPRAIYVMFLAWSVIMLAKALVGFVSAWKAFFGLSNYYSPLRIFVVFYILSIVADLTKLLWGCLYRPRWIEPSEPIGVLTDVVWLSMKMFFIYHIWFWYRTVKVHHDHNTYQSPSHVSRILRRFRRRTSQIDVPEEARLSGRRRSSNDPTSRPWWRRVGSNDRVDDVVLNPVQTIANDVTATTDSSTPVTHRT